MTDKASPDLLDLAEAVVRGEIRQDDAERQVRSSAESVRELRGLIAAARAVRSHAQATRDAAASESTAIAAPAGSIGTVIAGPVRAGAARRHPSNGGDGQPRRRTWLLAVATLLFGTGVIGAALVEGGLSAPTPSPTDRVAVSSPTFAPSSPTVVPMRAASWTPTGSMVTPRQSHTATLLPDGKVLVTGGGNGVTGVLASAELYDPATGTWTATGSMVAASAGHTATLLPDGKVLVVGGFTSTIYPDGSSTRQDMASAELYDPGTGTWTATGSMVTPRSDFTATLLADGKVLVAGGAGPSGILASAELYDPGTGSWTATGNMGTPRWYNTATLLPDGMVLAAGGVDHPGGWGPELASAELYDPAAGTWTATASMGAPRSDFTATLLADGKVLVVGGSVSAALYDPRTGSWTTTGSPVTSFAVRATLLPDGRVLVMGLIGTISQPDRTSAELYDPGSGTWTVAGGKSAPPYRNGFTSTLLPDCRVLVAGGFSDPQCPAGCQLASAELYDPGTGTP